MPGQFGGASSIKTKPAGSKTEFRQLRADYAFRPTPTTQLLAKVYHDIDVVGGFRHAIGVGFRLIDAF